jgi:antitoxin YefM
MIKMRATTAGNMKINFKTICNEVINGETYIISRPKDENIVVLSEREYNSLLKLKNENNELYTAKLNKSLEQAEKGDLIIKTLDELRAMENDV